MYFRVDGRGLLRGLSNRCTGLAQVIPDIDEIITDKFIPRHTLIPLSNG
jgi:hypothetical protein